MMQSDEAEETQKTAMAAKVLKLKYSYCKESHRVRLAHKNSTTGVHSDTFTLAEVSASA